MTEERITETETPSGETYTTHTIVTERRGGGGGWIIGIVVLLIAVAGLYFISQMSDFEVGKNNAMTEAAGDVGDAADKVGESADRVGEAVEGALDGGETE